MIFDAGFLGGNVVTMIHQYYGGLIPSGYHRYGLSAVGVEITKFLLTPVKIIAVKSGSTLALISSGGNKLIDNFSSLAFTNAFNTVRDLPGSSYYYANNDFSCITRYSNDKFFTTLDLGINWNESAVLNNIKFASVGHDGTILAWYSYYESKAALISRDNGLTFTNVHSEGITDIIYGVICYSSNNFVVFLDGAILFRKSGINVQKSILGNLTGYGQDRDLPYGYFIDDDNVIFSVLESNTIKVYKLTHSTSSLTLIKSVAYAGEDGYNLKANLSKINDYLVIHNLHEHIVIDFNGNTVFSYNINHHNQEISHKTFLI